MTPINQHSIEEQNAPQPHNSDQTIDVLELYKEPVKSHLFSGAPSIVIGIQKIQQNLRKQFQTSQSNCMIIVELVASHEKPKLYLELENIKTSYTIPLKQVFSLEKQTKISDFLQNLDLPSILRLKDKFAENQNEFQTQTAQSKFTWSIRLFPSHRSFDMITLQMPQQLVQLSCHDILSYQKTQRVCNYAYVFSNPGYRQIFSKQLETQIYLNWGQQQIEFIFTDKNLILYPSKKLKPQQLILIPGGTPYKWVSKGSSIGKLLVWKILPKRSLKSIMQNIQDSSFKKKSPYPMGQIFIDFIFHEFGVIQQYDNDTELIYRLANFINSQFQSELKKLQAVNAKQNQIENGAFNKKIDQCHECGQFIVNYFGWSKNNVYCLECAEKDCKKIKILQKMPSCTFLQGCQLLKNVKSHKETSQKKGDNVQKLMENIVFYCYEDICDGDFLGSYSNIQCKNIEQNPKKQKNSRERIVSNTVENLKVILSISSAAQILEKYSKRSYQSEAQKNLFKTIMVRASRFMKSEDQQQLLSLMLPNYEGKNLKLLAIKLCAKDKM